MKLSEAIRLGAMLRPQGFRALFEIDPPRSCALGAAFEAAGVMTPENWHRWYERPREWNAYMLVRCDGCGEVDLLYRIVTHLNDEHRWTREAIADFVERVERQHDSQMKAPEPTEAVA